MLEVQCSNRYLSKVDYTSDASTLWIDFPFLGMCMDSFPQDPYQPPSAELLAPESVPREGELRPIPFEDLEATPGFWRRVGVMFQLLFTNPHQLVDRIPVTEGLSAPLRFALFCALPITLLMALLGILMGVMGGFLATQASSKGPGAWLFAGMGFLYTVMMPVSVVVGFFLGGVINHFFLWIWGGLRQSQGLTQTLRANGYYLGFFMLFYLVPLLNFLVLLGGPALLGLALARVHRTDTWRGICAAYTPLCCGCIAYAGVFGILAAMGQLK